MTREERDADIVASYEAGETLRLIAERHGLTQQHVNVLLRAKGVRPNRSKANRWREQGQA